MKELNLNITKKVMLKSNQEFHLIYNSTINQILTKGIYILVCSKFSSILVDDFVEVEYINHSISDGDMPDPPTPDPVNYEELINKPSINQVQLIGNKNGETLLLLGLDAYITQTELANYTSIWED